MAERTVSVHLKAEIATYIARIRQAARETERFADRVERSTRRLPGEVSSHRHAFARAGEQLGDGVADGYRKRVVQVEKDTEKVARRSQRKFHALATAIIAGLPAASSAAIGVLTAGGAAAFVGLGAVALRENERVRASFRELGATVSSDLAADAAVMEDAFVDAAGQMGAAFQELRPQLREAFAASAPHIETLIAGVSDFAQNAMPGMITAVERAGPVMEGLSSLLASTGQGLGDFFDIVSENSVSTGQGLENLGALIQQLLTGTATVLGPLNDLWAEHGDEVAEVIGQLLELVGGLAGTALPVLGSALGSALTMLSGVLDSLEPISDVLGVGIGLWLTYAAAIRGLTAVQGVLTGLATSMKTVRTASIGMLGPVGVLIAAGMALGDAFSDELDTSELKAMDEQLTGMVEKGQADKAAAQFQTWAAVADMLGVSFEEFKAQMPGYTTAMEGVEVATDGTVTATGRLQGKLKAARGELDDVRSALREYADEQRAATDPVFALKRALDDVDEAQRSYSEAVKEHGPNSAEAKQATWDLAEAVGAAESAAILGGGSFEAFEAKIKQWAKEGRFTKQQLDIIAGALKRAKKRADEFDAVDAVADFHVRAEAAFARMARARRELNALDGKTANTFITTYLDTVIRGPKNKPSANIPGIPFAADGGRFGRGDMAVVGEEGAEIVRFGGPSEVIPHRESMRLLEQESRVVGAGSGGAVIGAPRGAGAVTVVNNYKLSAPNYVGSHDELLRTLRKSIRTEGQGDVQVALGSR